MTPAELLRAARDKVAQGWTQKAFARDAEGIQVRATDPRACAWCVVGAIESVTSDDDERHDAYGGTYGSLERCPQPHESRGARSIRSCHCAGRGDAQMSNRDPRACTLCGERPLSPLDQIKDNPRACTRTPGCKGMVFPVYMGDAVMCAANQRMRALQIADQLAGDAAMAAQEAERKSAEEKAARQAAEVLRQRMIELLGGEAMTAAVFMCFLDDLHPYECDDQCVHCNGEETPEHAPDTCKLCHFDEDADSEIAEVRHKLAIAREALRQVQTLRPRDEYHEDFGAVLWWAVPICEPPYCGTALDDDLPEHVTHWSSLPRVREPADAARKGYR